jgi:hypothetical protein
MVPAPVVAQVSRSPRQAQLRRFLTGCLIVPLGESEAHEAGRLLGVARMADVVDAVVVTVALRNKAVILTSDMDDMERLVTAAGGEVAVVAFWEMANATLNGKRLVTLGSIQTAKCGVSVRNATRMDFVLIEFESMPG